MANDRRAIIRGRNDAFRKAALSEANQSGRKLHTAGVDALPLQVIADIWRLVANFDNFTTDNDPHEEHDFGPIDHPIAGRIFWKIDYYDSSYQAGAEDPTDPSARRVLTVMLAEEY